MFGAIVGDIAGSRFETGKKPEYDFEIFHKNSFFTDDTVLTCAVAKALLICDGNFSNLGNQTIFCMQKLCSQHQNCGYGQMFYRWLKESAPKPYNSFGNGSAMRVSSVAYAANSLKEVIKLSKKVTEVTHNHPEGLKGAEAVAASIFMARSGKTKEEIKEYIEKNYYHIPKSEAEIQSTFIERTCQATVPQCFYAFFNSNSFEDAVRKAVCLGGDTDTLGAITGSIAEGFYGVPEKMKEKALNYLSDDLKTIIKEFENKYEKKMFVKKVIL